MSTPSAAPGRPPSDVPPRRPFQGGGRFDRPVMSQDKIDALIRQARDNAKRLMLDALQKTDPKYRSFIVPIGQWKKVGESGDRDIKAHVELPYMSVDGRVLMAIDEHMAQGKKIIIQPAEFKDDPVSGQKLCQVTVKAELRGEATGTARLFLGGGGRPRGKHRRGLARAADGAPPGPRQARRHRHDAAPGPESGLRRLSDADLRRHGAREAERRPAQEGDRVPPAPHAAHRPGRALPHPVRAARAAGGLSFARYIPSCRNPSASTLPRADTRPHCPSWPSRRRSSLEPHRVRPGSLP